MLGRRRREKGMAEYEDDQSRVEHGTATKGGKIDGIYLSNAVAHGGPIGV